MPLPSTSSDTAVVLRSPQPISQQAPRNATTITLSSASITFDPTHQTITFNIPTQVNSENITRQIIATKASQNLAENLKNASIYLSKQDLQVLKEKSQQVSVIFSHLKNNVVTKQMSLQSTTQQLESTDQPLAQPLIAGVVEAENGASIDDFLDNLEETEHNATSSQGDSSCTTVSNAESSSLVNLGTSNPVALDIHTTFTLHKDRIRQYCEKYAQKNKLNVEEYLAHAVQQVNLGGQNAYQILNEKLKVSKDTNELQSIIESLVWYFYSEHLGQSIDEDGFEEGTFIIPKEFAPFFEQAGYNRISSHAKFLEAGQNKGIDSNNLPQSKGHILFLQLEHPSLKNYCLLKPENHGTSGIVNSIFHLIEFIQATARKIEPLRRALDLSSDDDPTYCKERVPSDVKAGYNGLIKQFSLGTAHQSFEKAANIGIFAMYQKAKELDNSEFDLTLRKKAKEFTAMLESKYNHLDMRIGREVILSKEDLLLSSWIYQQKTHNENHLFLAPACTLVGLKALVGQHRNNRAAEKVDLENLVKGHIQALAQTDEPSPKDFEDELLKEYLTNTITICKNIQANEPSNTICNTQFLEYTPQRNLVAQIRFDQCKQAITKQVKQQFEELAKPYASDLSDTDTKKSLDDILDDIKDEPLKQAIQQLNNESTGIRKITELRGILGDDFGDIKGSITQLCKKITDLAVNMHRKGQTSVAISLCNEVHNQGIQFINNAINVASKDGFYTPQHHARNFIQVKTIQLQRHAANIYTKTVVNSETIKGIESLIESFEHQTGFFSNQAMLENAIEQEYNKTIETIERFINAAPQVLNSNANANEEYELIYNNIQQLVTAFCASSKATLKDSTLNIQADTSDSQNRQLTEKELKIQLLDEDSGPKGLHQLRSVLKDEHLSALLTPINQILDTVQKHQETTKAQLEALKNSWDNTLKQIFDVIHKHGFYTNYHADCAPMVKRYALALNRLEKERFRHYKKESQRSTHTESIRELFENRQSSAGASQELSIPQLLSGIHEGMSAMTNRAAKGIIARRNKAQVLGALEQEMLKIEKFYSKTYTSETNPLVRSLLNSAESSDIVIIDHDTLYI